MQQPTGIFIDGLVNVACRTPFKSDRLNGLTQANGGRFFFFFGAFAVWFCGAGEVAFSALAWLTIKAVNKTGATKYTNEILGF